MKKEFTTVEELLSDEDFLTWYFDPAGKKKEKWQAWKDWMDVDPARGVLLEEALRIMQDIGLPDRSGPESQPRISASRLMQHIDAIERKQRTPMPATNRHQRLFLFRNYLTLAFRNLTKEKGFSAINILGLALGLAVCLLITLYIQDELSYDRFNNKADRIYRLHADIRVNGNGFEDPSTPSLMGPALVRDFPQIQRYVRFTQWHAILVKKGNTTIFEPGAVIADSTIFDVFTLPLIAGNPHTALARQSSMVISESVAKKYFGSVDCLGKTLYIQNERNVTITGVMKDMPEQSDFHLRFIQSMTGEISTRDNGWLDNDYLTFVLVRPGVTAADLGYCLDRLTQTQIIPKLQDFLHGKTGYVADKGNHYRYYPFPLTKIHLYSSDEDGRTGIKYIYIFSVIAVFILLIACVNFMNLSTARSARRAKEVGIRKVLGSIRSQLIAQFLTESLLTSALAMVIALLLTTLLLPWLNQLSGKQITISFLSSHWLLPWLTATTLIAGLLAGLYPAFFLSAFRPVKVLKGEIAAGFRGGWLRNGLVVFQFTVAILLIVGTGVIYRQLNYIRHKDLGYDRDQVLVIRNTYSLWISALHFKQDVQQMPGVLGATMTFYLPNDVGNNSHVYFKDRSMTAPQAISLTRWPIDADYIPTLGMKMARGRSFSPTLTSDSTAVLINETAQQQLGYADPVGKTIYDPADSGLAHPYRIIGVVRDFQPGSLHNKIPPMLFNLAEERGALAVRVRTKDMPGLIARIEKDFRSWDKMSDQPFPYYFMDESFNNLYQDDQRTGTLFFVFAGLAILIGCLGLFGLVTYAAEQRTREIGIRKVLGASVSSIVSLLSKEFLGLTAIAALIAFPIAAWAMHKWLQGFAYRTTLSWWIFAAAGGMATAIGMLTISFRAIRAARANPVKGLRSE